MVQEVAGSNPVGRPSVMRVHLVQFDIAWEDKPTNWGKVESMLQDAAVEAGGVIVLPELGDVGFSMDINQTADDRSQAWAASLANQTGCWVVHGWAQHSDTGTCENVAGVLTPNGTLQGVATKLHPFSLIEGGESYQAGNTLKIFRDIAGTNLCPLICYDLRFPEVFRAASLAGADCFVVMANWPAVRLEHWRTLAIARAIENQTAVIACNRTGTDPNFTYGGGSLVVAADGQVLAEAGEESTILTAEIDFQAQLAWRGAFPALGDAKPHWQCPAPIAWH